MPLRLVSLEIDFDCVAGSYQQLFDIGIGDSMNQITSFDASESKPLNPGTNVGVAGSFACAAQEARSPFAQRLGGNASLEEALRVSRALEAPSGHKPYTVLIPNHMHRDFALMRRVAMFEKINPLPSA